MPKSIPLVVLALSLFFACSDNTTKRDLPTKPQANHFDTLLTYMTGTFSSAQQAAKDSSYYAICLEMHPVWNRTEVEAWMYVEQSLASMTDKPYRQRVYRVLQLADSSFASEVYTLEDPLRFTGQWENQNYWGPLTPDSLNKKEGCSVYLELLPSGIYTGGTDSATCVSTLRGASYADSEVVIDANGITSWDRGYDSTGVQVWGAEKGGYRFQRENP